jgi:hypothetical protein
MLSHEREQIVSNELERSRQVNPEPNRRKIAGDDDPIQRIVASL